MYHPVVFLGGGGEKLERGDDCWIFNMCGLACTSTLLLLLLLLRLAAAAAAAATAAAAAAAATSAVAAAIAVAAVAAAIPAAAAASAAAAAGAGAQPPTHNPPSLTCPPRQLVGRDAGCGGVRRLFSVPGEPSTLKTKSKPQTPNSKP